MRDLTISEINRYNNLRGKVVTHFKGKDYLVHGLVEHTETGESMIHYTALYEDCKSYVRPAKMFLSEVDREKYPSVTQHFRMELKK